ncbi:MAG: tripartite tricarboxylate transporter TctB family protein [Clostridia bacterium]
MEKRLNKINKDVSIGIGLILFSIFFLYESTKIHKGAAEFPKIILLTFLILSIILVVIGITKTLNPTLEKKSDKKILFSEIKSPLIVFLISAVYIALINIIGFFIATTLFVPIIMWYYGIRRFRQILVTTICLDLFIYVLFVRLLNVFLP